MDQQTSNRQTGTIPMPEHKQYGKFNLSSNASFMLFNLADKQENGEYYTVADLPDDPDDPRNVSFNELLQHKLIEIGQTDMRIRVTNKGLYAVDKRVVITYAMPHASGTSRPYRLTFMTQTANAKSTMLNVLASMAGAYFANVSKRSLNAFVSSLYRSEVYKRLSSSVNTDAYKHLKSTMLYYASKWGKEARVNYIAEEAQSWEAQLDLEISNMVDANNGTLSTSAMYDDYNKIEKVYRDDKGSIVASYHDAAEGYDVTVPLENMTTRLKHEILINGG